MEQNINFYIGIYKALAIIGSVIGSVGCGSWYAAVRLTRVETKVETFENRLTSMEGRLDGAFTSKSPVALLPKGKAILEVSGLKKYIERHKKELFRSCRAGNPPRDLCIDELILTVGYRYTQSLLRNSQITRYLSKYHLRELQGLGQLLTDFEEICNLRLTSEP